MYNGYIQVVAPRGSSWLMVLITEHGCSACWGGLNTWCGAALSVSQFLYSGSSPCLLHLPLHWPSILWMDLERATIVHIMYLTPILSTGWGSAGPASASQQVCAECLSSCYSSSPDSTDHSRDNSRSQGKPQNITTAHRFSPYPCHRYLMVGKTNHAPRDCAGLIAVRT